MNADIKCRRKTEPCVVREIQLSLLHVEAHPWSLGHHFCINRFTYDQKSVLNISIDSLLLIESSRFLLFSRLLENNSPWKIFFLGWGSNSGLLQWRFGNRTFDRPAIHNITFAFWSLPIELKVEVFLIVLKCKQDSKALTNSSFAGIIV